jgi:hypothetical protein
MQILLVGIKLTVDGNEKTSPEKQRNRGKIEPLHGSNLNQFFGFRLKRFANDV